MVMSTRVNLTMEDLSKKTDIELKELLGRQSNILAKKAFVSKLKDGGSKIRNLKKHIEEELDRRKRDKSSSELVDITSKSALLINAIETLEWTGKYAENNERLDVDDDSSEETDPLKILAAQAGPGKHKILLRKEKPEESFITSEDLKECSLPMEVSKDDFYANHLCYRDETTKKSTKIPFKPHSTIKVPVSPSHGYKRPKGPHWEVTAATQPDYSHGDAKSISLTESLKLQKVQSVKLKEVQSKQAADRLAVQIERLYLSERRGSDASTSASNADEAAHDSEHGDDDADDDRGGVVIYSLVD